MAHPVNFPEANATYESTTKGVGDLPCFSDDEMIISCWELSEEERKQVVDTGRLWLGQMHYGAPLQPQAVWFKNPFEEPSA
jgi:hypothetical protein